MSQLNISLLGTFQITLAHQPITHFRSTNNQGLLVYLLLQPEKPIARDSLMALFWPDAAEAQARNNLRQALYQCRKLLGDLDNRKKPYLSVSRQTAQFNATSDYALDVQQFLADIDAGDLETAVSHYHGDLLPGFTCDSLEFENWLRQERESLHNLALETMVELTRDHLQNGRYQKAQTIARQQLNLEPWRERAHRQLMHACVLAGDRNKALAQFEVCKETLWDELGVDLAPETVTLFEDIKAGRYGATISDAYLTPPIKVRHNLPAELTPLIGRELERSQIKQQLTQDGHRLVTIVGPGGMGKTRLAIAIGKELLTQFQDGVYFVDLAPLAEADEIPSTIAAVLDYQAPNKSEPLLPQLLKAIREQQFLFILDNFEHLLARAKMVTDILQTCPQVSLLVTSRQRLNLASESRFELGGLTFPDYLTPQDAQTYTAVQLFVENGRRVQPDFTVTDDNLTDITHICQLVQGMPLGLVLAASWLEMLTPAEITTEIENSLDFLSSELSDLPPRQRSMQAVFDYSWQLMTTSEQAALAKLSVFRGGFTRDAAEKVAHVNLRQLLSLVSKSLVQRNTENGRFTIHELLRQFAAGQRKQLEENEQTARAHCRYFAQIVKQSVRQSLSPYPMLLLQQHKEDIDNLRRAWDFALAQGLAQELSDLARGRAFIEIRLGEQARPLIEEALMVLQQRGLASTDPRMIHLNLVALRTRQGLDDIHEVKDDLLAYMPFVETHGDLELQYRATSFLANVYLWISDVPQTVAWYQKAIQLAKQLDNDLHIKLATTHLLSFSLFQNLRAEEASAQLENLHVYYETNFPNSFALYLLQWALSHHYRQLADYEKALFYGKRSLNIAKYWQDLFWIGFMLQDIGETYAQMGYLEKAKQQHLDGLEWHLAIGQTWQTVGYIWGEAADHSEFIDNQETAVAILSMAYHHPESIPHYIEQIDWKLPQIKETIGDKAFVQAWEEGKTMSFDTAVSLLRTAYTTTNS